MTMMAKHVKQAAISVIIIIIIIMMLPNQAIASTPSAPRPSGAEGRGSTAPLCYVMAAISVGVVTHDPQVLLTDKPARATAATQEPTLPVLLASSKSEYHKSNFQVLAHAAVHPGVLLLALQSLQRKEIHNATHMLLLSMEQLQHSCSGCGSSIAVCSNQQKCHGLVRVSTFHVTKCCWHHIHLVIVHTHKLLPGAVLPPLS
jgi:hypothetical protein